MPRIKEDSAKKKRLQAKSAQIGEPENIFDDTKVVEEVVETKEPVKVETPTEETTGEEQKEVKVARKPKLKGKKHKNASSLVENKDYTIEEAVALVKKTSYTKFPGTVEVHLTLADKELRGTLSLPHGSGKSVKVLAFVPDAKIKEATDAGAAHAGGKEVADKIKEGKLVPGRDFNAVVADPSMMPTLAPLAKMLGPKGLMPNPKTNTVGTNIPQLVTNLVKGQVTYKAETPNPYLVHMPMGKTTFKEEQLVENFNTLIQIFGSNKVKKVVISATMSPGIRIHL